MKFGIRIPPPHPGTPRIKLPMEIALERLTVDLVDQSCG